MKQQITVAEYLSTRLMEQNIDTFFGVPGNHLGPCISEFEKRGIKWIGGTNEMNIGYAADAYARHHGFAAVGVTYGVGALSILNPISGAYVEGVPILVINASPTYEQQLSLRDINLLTSHMSDKQTSNLDAYHAVTGMAIKINNARLAPSTIDAAIIACLTDSKPVYLEISENVFSGLCDAPQGKLASVGREFNKENAKKAAKVTAELMNDRKTYPKGPALWLGHELRDYGLQEQIVEVMRKYKLPACSSVMGKGVISEANTLFKGIYSGSSSQPDVKAFFEDEDRCRIGLGAWSTSKNLGGVRSMGDDWVMSMKHSVTVGTQYFPNVGLNDFLTELDNELGKQFAAVPPVTEIQEVSPAWEIDSERGFCYDNLFARLNQWLWKSEQQPELKAIAPDAPGLSANLISDAGFSLIGSQNTYQPVPNRFHSQASWLSIGYSLGAVTGLQYALKGAKEEGDHPAFTIVCIGDGAFQETAQSLSDLIRSKSNALVLVMNNENFYGIEQMLVDSSYYKKDNTSEGDSYNHIQPWQYSKLLDVFQLNDDAPVSIKGSVVSSNEGFSELLDNYTAELKQSKQPHVRLVQCKFDRKDYPRGMQYRVDRV